MQYETMPYVKKEKEVGIIIRTLLISLGKKKCIEGTVAIVKDLGGQTNTEWRVFCVCVGTWEMEISNLHK